MILHTKCNNFIDYILNLNRKIFYFVKLFDELQQHLCITKKARTTGLKLGIRLPS